MAAYQGPLDYIQVHPRTMRRKRRCSHTDLKLQCNLLVRPFSPPHLHNGDPELIVKTMRVDHELRVPFLLFKLLLWDQDLHLAVSYLYNPALPADPEAAVLIPGEDAWRGGAGHRFSHLPQRDPGARVLPAPQHDLKHLSAVMRAG